MRFQSLGVVFLLACLSFLLLPDRLRAQQRDNQGTDFILAFMPNDSDAPFGQQVVELHLTSVTTTTALVEYPVNDPTFTQSVDVAAGQITVVSLPTSAANIWQPDMTGQNNCVRVSAPNEVVCYMNNRDFFTSDAAIALPTDTFGMAYVVAGFPSLVRGAQFVLLASEDNTTISIRPTAEMVGNRLANVQFDIQLDAGEGYYGLAFNSNEPLTGTWIDSNKPIGLVNGSYCANVPSDTGFCDHIFEMAQPVSAWGKEFIVSNLPLRPGGSIYRILASEDDTTVLQNGAPMTTIDHGEFYETPPLTGDHVFTADKAIYIVQYMTGSTSLGAQLGDPSMCNMIPLQQFQSNYTFSTIGNNEFANHFLTVIAKTTDAGELTLDGIPIPATDFTEVPGTAYSTAIVTLTEGAHTTSSANGHAITIEGYNNFNSYCYPGGVLSKMINPTVDENPPECFILRMMGVPITMIFASDDRPNEDVNMDGMVDPVEDLNGNGLIDEDTGILSIELTPGSMNIEIATMPFPPGVPDRVLTISLIDPAAPGFGVVRVTDVAGNVTTCPITLGSVECFMIVGNAAAALPIDPSGGDMLLVDPDQSTVVGMTLWNIPTFPIPVELDGASIYAQAVLVNPELDHIDPVRVSWGVEMVVGGGVTTYGKSTGLTLWPEQPVVSGGILDLQFGIPAVSYSPQAPAGFPTNP